MSVTVLLATRYLQAQGVPEAITAIDPRLRVRTCLYAEPPERRAARSRAGTGDRLDLPAPSLAERDALAEADVLVALDVPADLPALAPRLRWCHLISSGTSHVAYSGLPAPGVALTHSPGGNAPGVAEFVLARIFEHAKLLPQLAAMQRRRDGELCFGRRVAGQLLTIVGLGWIGREIAARAHALGMVVRAVVHRPPTSAPDGVRVTTDLAAALADADVTVLCASDRAENRNLFDEAAFAAMKHGSFFVNVSRGVLVDEAALAAALHSGQLAAAALDVTVHEPLPATHPLWDAPNLRLSFHSASTQDGMVARRLEIFTTNLRRYLSGEPLAHTVPAFSATDRPALP